MAVTAVIRGASARARGGSRGDAAVQAMLIALLALLPSIIGIVYAQDLLRLMGADAWAIEHGYKYTQWMLGGNAVIMLLFVINAIFRRRRRHRDARAVAVERLTSCLPAADLLWHRAFPTGHRTLREDPGLIQEAPRRLRKGAHHEEI